MKQTCVKRYSGDPKTTEILIARMASRGWAVKKVLFERNAPDPPPAQPHLLETPPALAVALSPPVEPPRTKPILRPIDLPEDLVDNK